MKKFALAAFGVVSLVSAPALAGSATSNYTVTATVLTTCTISTVGIVFGNYDPTSSTPLDQTGSVVVTCTSGTSSTIAMSQGANAATGSTDAAPLRQMANGTQRLRYDLYQNAARTTVWGNTVGTSLAYTATSALPQTFSIFGRIPINQSAAAGAYLDTVTATINF